MRRGIARAAIPNRKPPISRIRGIRLYGCIFAKGDFPLRHVAARSCHYDGNRNEANEANHSESEVGTSEDGPGFHVSFSN